MAKLRQPGVLPSGPASVRWWLGLLTAALFSFHIHYVPLHLLTEVHHSHGSTASAQTVDHHHDHPDEDDHDHGQHQPHSASMHQLQLAGKQPSSQPLVVFLLPEALPLMTLPEPLVVHSTLAHGNRPGESPPDPRQPRAPPPV